MDSPTERMPIACVHCAKAKAKCDKKVPCSRCVSKQIVCQSRATRRSSHNPNRRSNLPRPNSERNLPMAAAFHVSQLSSPPQNGPILSPNLMSPHHGMQQHRLSLPNIGHPMHISPNMFGQEVEPQMLQNGYTHTPPDINIPITPVMPNMPHLDNFMTMNGSHFDPEHDNQFLNMSSGHSTMMDFDTSNMMNDFMSPPSLMQDMNDQLAASGKGYIHSPNQMTFSSKDGSTMFRSRLDVESPRQYMHFNTMQARVSPSTSSSFSSRGLQEPDAVIASHQAWPFFQCNTIERSPLPPPKTAAIYLEGLAQTLKDQGTWQAWKAQADETSLDFDSKRNVSSKPVEGWSREKLLAITQGFLHKALDIHKAGHRHNSRDNSPGGSPDSGHGTFLMLPPPDVMQYFLKSYLVRYESYYSSIPGAWLDPSALMQSANGKAASLLILLMVACGACATPTVEARYLASGLTEACRISLFDLIEKDITQAREPLVLRAALLFTTLAAWSGDKWHMDIAMGQRGMYLAMLGHAGMLEAFNERIDILECQRSPDSAWEEWKEYEAKNRLASSWIIVDQEISMFSDETPRLAVVNMHAPTPDAEAIWEAASSTEWLTAFEKAHGTSYQCPPSVRELFGKFVEGDLPIQGQPLSPTQLRLLLHPLQAQVCQLRQFISCLPDGGSRAGASRGVSRAANQGRLEEISALLQQWYSISQQCSANQTGPCWTTAANLVMYHLISLNAITSFKCIEQFGRREVVAGPFRPNNWLQTRCIDQAEETVFHCGQVLRLIKSMPKQVRPPWWAGAVYRVAMTGWANSMANSANCFVNNGRNGHPSSTDKPFPVDALTPDHESISKYLKYQEGVPMLSKSDGSLIPLDAPLSIINHCVDILEEDSGMRLTEGIKLKLRRFGNSWKDN